MDQGIVSTSGGHYVRLLLSLLAAVFGLVGLGLVLGTSPASADDGSDGGGLAPASVARASETVSTVAQAPATAVAPDLGSAAPVIIAPVIAPVAKPVAETVAGAGDDLLTSQVVGTTLGIAPVAAVLAPVAGLLDSAVGTIGHAVLPVLHGLSGIAPVAAGLTLATTTAAGALPVSGDAQGLWSASGLGPDGDASVGAAPVATGLLAAVLASGLFLIFFVRRAGLTDGAVLCSPVYETDTSPD